MGARLLMLTEFLQLFTFLFKCAQSHEISLVLLCSYFLHINDKSVMTWLRQKACYLSFQPVFNSSACNCCGGAVCIIGKTHEAIQQAFWLLFNFGYCLIPYHISSAPQAFCFLKCSWLARKICQMLVLAKINTLLACSQRPFYTPTIIIVHI